MSIPASSSFLKPLWPLSPHRCNYCRGAFTPTAPGSSCCAEFCRPARRGGPASHTQEHTSVKVKCATPEGCSSSAVCPPGRVHLGAAGGRLQCAPTALQSRHQTGEWQQDLSPALRATMKKKTRLRGSLPFNYLKRKSKPMATSYAPTQEGTA